MQNIHIKLAQSLAAGAVVFAITSCQKKAPTEQEQKPHSMPPIAVETTPAYRGEITQMVTFLGTVRWRQRTQLSAEIPGRIIKLNYQPGGVVARNDILIEFDANDYTIARASAEAELGRAESELKKIESGTRSEVIAQISAQLDEARARLERSHKDLIRIKGLHERSVRNEADLIAAQADYDIAAAQLDGTQAHLLEARNGATTEEKDVARAEIAVLRSRVDQARNRLQKKRIFAPFDGVVLSKQVDIGAFVDIGSKLLEFGSLENLEAHLQVPEGLVGAIGADTKFRISADAWQTESFPAQVIRLIPDADLYSRNVILRASVKNIDNKLIPGMFVRATYPIEHKTDAVLVPKDAIVYRKEKPFIFLVIDGKAQILAADLGLQGVDTVEILDGIKPGDSVVVNGGEILFPGASVVTGPAQPTSGGPQ